MEKNTNVAVSNSTRFSAFCDRVFDKLIRLIEAPATKWAVIGAFGLGISKEVMKNQYSGSAKFGEYEVSLNRGSKQES